MINQLESTKLREMCQFVAGNVFKIEYQGFTIGEYPFIKVSDLELPGNAIRINTANNWVSAKLAKQQKYNLHKKGAIVFPKIGVALTSNRGRLITQDTIIDNNLMCAVASNKCSDSRFLYYLLCNLDFNKISSGSAIPYLTVKDLKEISVPLFPASDQIAISKFLGTIDNKIELNHKMNQTLEECCKAIFKSWFVDFDPVRAKIEGRLVGLPQEISDIFPDELVDSEIGKIPRGWCVKNISDLADCVGGATPSTKNPDFWEEGNIAWTTPKDLSNSTSIHLMKTDRKITKAGLKKISSGQLPAGTVLLSSRAPVGYLALTIEPTAINQGYIALKPAKNISNYFLLNWCKYSLDEIKSRASGTTFAEISKSAFRPIPVIMPAQDLMSNFHRIAEPMYERMLLLSKENETLTNLRDTLLPKLISGKLRIPDAEKFLKEAGI